MCFEEGVQTGSVWQGKVEQNGVHLLVGSLGDGVGEPLDVGDTEVGEGQFQERLFHEQCVGGAVFDEEDAVAV